jgi:hypothetical protein
MRARRTAYILDQCSLETREAFYHDRLSQQYFASPLRLARLQCRQTPPKYHVCENQCFHGHERQRHVSCPRRHVHLSSALKIMSRKPSKEPSYCLEKYLNSPLTITERLANMGDKQKEKSKYGWYTRPFDAQVKAARQVRA